MEGLSVLLTIFVSIGVITFFISTFIGHYFHREYEKMQIKDKESIHFILIHTNVRLGSYYLHDKLNIWIKIVSIEILHDDRHGGYYIRLNNEYTVDKHTVISIYNNGYYYQNE